MNKIIIELLPFLFLAISANIATGLYYSLAKIKDSFSFGKMLIGLGKAFIISYTFITTSIVYDKIFGVVSVGDLELAPDLLIKSAIVMYLGKALLNLKDILKVDKVLSEKAIEIEEEIEEIKY